MGGGYAAILFLLLSFPCSADHEREWPPCKVVFRVGNQYAECEKQQQQQQQHQQQLRPSAPGQTPALRLGAAATNPFHSLRLRDLHVRSRWGRSKRFGKIYVMNLAKTPCCRPKFRLDHLSTVISLPVSNSFSGHDICIFWQLSLFQASQSIRVLQTAGLSI